jgi:hypothetical protein
VDDNTGCYESEFGVLKIRQVDIELLHKKASESLPEKPVPPLVQMTRERFTIKESLAAAKLSEKRGIPIDLAEEEICKQFTFSDAEDEDYVKELNHYNYLLFLLLSGFVIGEGVLLQLNNEYKTYTAHVADGNERPLIKSDDYYTLHMILTNMTERSNLYKRIARYSEMTWEGILEAGKKIGATRYGKPILEVSSSGGGQEAQPLIAIALAAAAQYNIPPLEYRNMSVVEQEYIVAQYLTQRWLEHWAYEDKRKEMK